LVHGTEFSDEALGLWKEAVHEEFRSIPVKFIGVWDTVGTLSLGYTGKQPRFFKLEQEKFHNTNLSANITHAYHALAAHELRKPFKPVFWTEKASDQVLEQVWFKGAHANVGGGYNNVGLSSISLCWMASKAIKCGMAVNLDTLRDECEKKDITEPIEKSRSLPTDRNWLKKLGLKPYPKLERPIVPTDIKTYLKEHFPKTSYQNSVINDIKVHYSALIFWEELYMNTVYFDDDLNSFKKIDRQLLSLNTTP